MNRISTGWYKVYRPTKIKDYVFQNDFERDKILGYIKNGDIPDLLLSGHRGLGKTTLGLILKNELGIDDIDFLWLNASDENSVDTIRSTIKPFISSMSMGDFKIVFLDEGDSLTPQAQKALKSMMEDEARNARFIITCNQPEKIIPEIRSRCTEYKFSGLSKKSMKEIGLKILMDRGLDAKHVDVDELSQNLKSHLNVAYPDFRKFITGLEQHYVGGKLLPPTIHERDLELYVELVMGIEEGNWQKCRDLIYERLPTDDITTVFSFLDQHMNEVSGIGDNPEKMKRAFIILANYAYRNETIAIPELNLLSCVIKLCDLTKEQL
jgi:DNA polymerase III delta prime subunit